MKEFRISLVSHDLEQPLKQLIDQKTKPLGSLGMLEELALRVGLIQQSVTPQLNNPTIVLFAGDHGISEEGVSAYPQAVTRQMVMNILQGGAAISVFCRQNGLALWVVDAGVNGSFSDFPGLINAKIGFGTDNFLYKPAMSIHHTVLAIERGAEIASTMHENGCNVIGFGEMGIGNTSSASMLTSILTNTSLEECVGRGTGLNDRQMERKVTILSTALHVHPTPQTPIEALATFGGFEIAQMTGAILQAAERKMIILVDGFIATTAFLVAYHINSNVLGYGFFSHLSEEAGHATLLRFFRARPMLSLGLKLGEGTGCALAFPLVKNAVAFLTEMASFEGAGVSEKLRE